MQTDNRLLDDLAKMAGGALNALTGMKTEIEGLVRQQIEHFVANMHLVTREEFDVVQALAAKARDEQETLTARLASLEAELAALKSAVPGAAVKPARKPKDDGTEQSA
ncbi:MAG TPA: accessory factor UbiK family protein [Telmatospirillum sp.]|nr:accessory factor UbiK family protein [Telmatospirillum sp.]